MTASSLLRGCHLRLLRVRPLPAAAIGLFLAANLALVLVFRTAAFVNGVSAPLEAATGGLVDHALVSNLATALVLFGGLAAGGHRLALRDLLLRGGRGGCNDLVRAAAFTLLIWMSMHAVAAATGALAGSPMGVTPPAGPRAAWAGHIVGVVFGTALVEEVIYRGLLLGQAFAAAGRLGLHGERQLFAAVAVSQALFGLGHLPLGLHLGWTGALLGLYLAQVVLVGGFFAAVVLRTGNLWTGVGVHALVNAPTLLVASPVSPRLIALTVSFAVLIAVPVLLDRFFPALGPARRVRRSLPPAHGDETRPRTP
jgi:hypothetical protein